MKPPKVLLENDDLSQVANGTLRGVVDLIRV